MLTSVFDFVKAGDDGSQLKALKAVRTLRLLKLIKLARGSRVFKRWEMRLSINYKALSLCQTLTGIVLTCHWTACFWGIIQSFDPLNSWAGPHATAYCVPWGDTEQSEADAFSSVDAYPCPYELEDPRDGRVHVYPECTDGHACVDWLTMCTQPCASNPHAALPHAPATCWCRHPTPPSARDRHLLPVLCDHDDHERGFWRRQRLAI